MSGSALSGGLCLRFSPPPPTPHSLSQNKHKIKLKRDRGLLSKNYFLPSTLPDIDSPLPHRKVEHSSEAFPKLKWHELKTDYH